MLEDGETPKTLLNFLHSCTLSVCYPSVQISKFLRMVAQKEQANPMGASAKIRQKRFSPSSEHRDVLHPVC